MLYLWGSRRWIGEGAHSEGRISASFELLLDKKEWRKMLLNDVYSSHLHTLVTDEAHTVKKLLSPFHALLFTAFLCRGETF